MLPTTGAWSIGSAKGYVQIPKRRMDGFEGTQKFDYIDLASRLFHDPLMRTFRNSRIRNRIRKNMSEMPKLLLHSRKKPRDRNLTVRLDAKRLYRYITNSHPDNHDFVDAGRNPDICTAFCKANQLG